MTTTIKIALAGVLLAATCAIASAQPSPTVRVKGTIEKSDGNVLTLKTAAGAEITISTSGDTTYHQQAAATSSDVKTGSTVLVRVNGFRGGRFGGGANASPAPSGAPRTAATATDITVVP